MRHRALPHGKNRTLTFPGKPVRDGYNTLSVSQKMDTRVAATRVLLRVFGHDVSLTEALIEQPIASTKRPLLKELCYGALRWHGQLSEIAKRFLSKPFRRKDRDIQYLLHIGLYQLIYMRIPAHAVVNETVSAVRVLGKPWAATVINGILRNFLRNQEDVLVKINHIPAVKWSQPDWFIDRIKKSYPGDWQQICECSNVHPPMTLRVNLSVIDRHVYLERLQDKGIAADLHTSVASAIVLRQPVDVGDLPGFDSGWVSVQDAAAQLAAPLLDVRPGMRVLDACAAPGGKTAHILEIGGQGFDLLALDKNSQRVTMLRTTLSRLQLHATIREADALKPQSWWDGQAFDRVLLDAPCSATGVIRRHPDIKWRRSAQDIERMADQQYELLSVLWSVVKSGGMLLYATCSLFPEENAYLIEKFLSENQAARLVSGNQADTKSVLGWQILPGEQQMDGFYYARLHKIS